MKEATNVTANSLFWLAVIWFLSRSIRRALRGRSQSAPPRPARSVGGPAAKPGDGAGQAPHRDTSQPSVPFPYAVEDAIRDDQFTLPDGNKLVLVEGYVQERNGVVHNTVWAATVDLEDGEVTDLKRIGCDCSLSLLMEGDDA